MPMSSGYLAVRMQVAQGTTTCCPRTVQGLTVSLLQQHDFLCTVSCDRAETICFICLLPQVTVRSPPGCRAQHIASLA